MAVNDVTIRVDGPGLDLGTRDALLDQVMRCLEGPRPAPDRVVLDVSDVEFADSVGLGAFVAARSLNYAGQPVGPVRLRGVQPRVMKMLTLTNLIPSVFSAE